MTADEDDDLPGLLHDEYSLRVAGRTVRYTDWSNFPTDTSRGPPAGPASDPSATLVDPHAATSKAIRAINAPATRRMLLTRPV
jgi:hypothetical protein